MRVKSSGRTYAFLSIDPKVWKRKNAPWDAVEARVLAKVEELQRAGVPVCADGNRSATLKKLGLAPLVEIVDGVSDPNLLLVNARRLGDTAFWFVANIDTNAVDVTLRLRLLKDRETVLELWDPETGVRDALPCQIANGVATVMLHMERERALFVVAGHPGASSRGPHTECRPLGSSGRADGQRASDRGPRALLAEWTLTFPAKGGAPTEPNKLSSLKSWTAFDEPGIRYFSGTATYETTLMVPEPYTYTLDLGDVCDLAEVLLDGRPVRTLWHRPYRMEVYLREGEHRLTVKVTNAWTNRLIGDEKEPDDCVLAKEMAGFGPRRNQIKEFIPLGRPVIELPEALRTNGERAVKRHAFSTWRYNLSDKDLRPAGLLGPVTLTPVEFERKKQ